MNRLETAKYIVDEFMDHGKTVSQTREGVDRFEWVIVYEDGSKDTVTGKFAADLRNAEAE